MKDSIVKNDGSTYKTKYNIYHKALKSADKH